MVKFVFSIFIILMVYFMYFTLYGGGITFKVDACYEKSTDDPFPKPTFIKVVDIKGNYLQYKYFNDSTILWSSHKHSMDKIFKEVDCKQFIEQERD